MKPQHICHTATVFKGQGGMKLGEIIITADEQSRGDDIAQACTA